MCCAAKMCRTSNLRTYQGLSLIGNTRQNTLKLVDLYEFAFIASLAVCAIDREAVLSGYFIHSFIHSLIHSLFCYVYFAANVAERH